MTCSHLKKLYQLCKDNGLRISSSDLIKIVCTECGEHEVCPSNLVHDEPITHDDIPTDRTDRLDSSSVTRNPPREIHG